MSATTDHDLSPELLALEQQLTALVPSAMSPELSDRMEQSMAGVFEHAVNGCCDFDDLEIHLEQMAPATMPDDILGRMVRAMDRWHENVPIEEKVVPFGEAESARKARGGGMLAAAAAVAMLGAVTALVIPRFFDGNQPVVPNTTAAIPVNEANLLTVGSIEPRDAWLVPDSLSHNVTNTVDHGVVMSRDNTPHRCIRVEYVDRLKVQDDEGREIEIERPGVDYVLLPVETY